MNEKYNGQNSVENSLVNGSLELQTELREGFLTQSLIQGHRRSSLKPVCECPDYNVLSFC